MYKAFLLMQKKTIKFKAKLFFENNIIPTYLEVCRDLLFAFCGVSSLTTSKLLYEKHRFCDAFFVRVEYGHAKS